MPTSPLLGITQLTPNQTGKETTINTAINALEAATNATLAVNVSAGNVTLSASQFTSNFLFKATGPAAAARILNIPAQVNGVNVQRLFAVRNASGQQLTVQVTGAPGTIVIIPDTESRLLDVDGAGNVKVVAMPPRFLSISDVPSSYAGQAKAHLRVKATEDGLEFRAPRLADLSVDVDTTSTLPTDGQALIFQAAGSKWVPGTVATAGGGSGGGVGSGVATMQPKPATGLAAYFPTIGNSLTVTEVNGKGLYLTGAPATTAMRYALKPLPIASDTTITVLVRGSLLADFNMLGCCIKDAATGKLVSLGFGRTGTLEFDRWNTDTARASTVGGGTAGPDSVWFRLSYVASTKAITGQYSYDGVTWFTVVTADAFLANPSHMGISYQSWNATTTGGGYVMYYDDGTQSFDFDPSVVPTMNLGTVSLSYRIAFGFEDNIASINYVIGRHTCVETFTIPANFAGSVASIASNPLAPQNVTLKKNGVVIGTVSISTTGVMTFATTGGTSVNCNIGDVIVASVDTTDANSAGFAMTLKA